MTIDDARCALIVAARLVDLYGEIALPLFERMERDLIVLYRQQAAAERARRIAESEDLSAYQAAAQADPFKIFETIDSTDGSRKRS